MPPKLKCSMKGFWKCKRNHHLPFMPRSQSGYRLYLHSLFNYLQISLMPPPRCLAKCQRQCPEIKWVISKQKQVYVGTILVEGKENAGPGNY